MTCLFAIALFAAVFAFGFVTCYYMLMAFLREHGADVDGAFAEYLRRRNGFR